MIARIQARLYKYKQSHGLLSLILLPFFPIILLITNPVRIFRSLWSARMLANGKWSEYNRFRPQNGINSLFYWTEAINFDRFGRNGVSPYVSTGNYHLGNWWFASLTSTYLYWRIGVMLPLLSMFSWLCIHFLWLGEANIEFEFFFLTIILAFISSYFYGGAFVFLNYNALGWVFMPLGLFGLITQNYWIAGMAWLAASLGSLTVVFIAGWLSLVIAALNQTIWPLLVILPAIIKLATHFFFVKNLKESLWRVMTLIGLNRVTNSNVKYAYPKNGNLFTINSIYFIATWSCFSCILYIYGNVELSILNATIIILWIINSSIGRFADEQSLYMAVFSIATFSVLLNPSFWLFISYWLGISPIPLLLGSGSSSSSYLKAKSYVPFHIHPLVECAKNMLAGVPENSRILLVLDNPNGQYDKIFDGYRTNYELIFYAGNLKKILVFPDWWAISENNTADAPEFWGREPEEVITNIIYWRAEYVLIYQNSNTELETKWVEAGFIEISHLDWGDLKKEYMDGEICWPNNQPDPKWFLLKAPSKVG